MVQAVEQQRTVGQTGEFVVHGAVGHCFLQGDRRVAVNADHNVARRHVGQRVGRREVVGGVGTGQGSYEVE